ncbi:DUF456 domain-containing protein [Chitinibacter tainanensis]|uniref:DUF456 domain-containing protein n=1 Tax=Chitinibacter tainanensis TaxID=230667 RepID=UPI002352F223|nr:DUF456 family protein [Chitinibacter tainanensis]
MELLWWGIALGCMLLGLAGIILPLLPSTPLIFAGMLILAWHGDFQLVGGWTLAVLAGLMLIASALDYLAGALGAKMAGASRSAMLGATIGAVLGVFAGPIGLIFGPLVGATAGELYAGRAAWQAGKVGIASWLGTMLGNLAKLLLALLMLGIFWAAYFI